MQFQVPQFIETEDKIVWQFSIRQFIYVSVGVGFAALLYFVLQTWIWIIFASIIVGGALAIAFVKVQGRPLAHVIFSAVNYYWAPQTYVWQPEHPSVNLKKEEEPKKKSLPSFSLEKVARGGALHQSWAALQTGEKISDRQLTENKMYGRYQIYNKPAGDRQAARRVDYR